MLVYSLKGIKEETSEKEDQEDIHGYLRFFGGRAEVQLIFYFKPHDLQQFGATT